MPRPTRRETFGLGLGGLSVTMLSASRRRPAPPRSPPPSACCSSTTSTRWATTRAAAASPSSPAVVKAGAGARRADAVLPCGRHLLALADVRLRPGRPHRRADQHVKPDVFVPGNHEFDFGKDNYLKLMGRVELPVLRRQPARGGRLADAGHEGRADLRRCGPSRSASSGSRSRRRRACRSPAISSFCPEMEALEAQAASAAAGRRGRRRRRHAYRPRDGLRDRALAPRRHAAHRPRPRPRHRLRRQDRDGGVERGGQFRHRDRLRRDRHRRGHATARSPGRRTSASTIPPRRPRPGGRSPWSRRYEARCRRSSTSRSARARPSSTAAPRSCARRRRRSAT